MKTISDHILDITENSVRARATLIEIIVNENKSTELYRVELKDNGIGMTNEEIRKAVQPFFTTRTTRKVGLGLPLLKHNAEQTGGSLKIISQKSNGTVVTADFGLNHIDRPVMGDMAGVFVLSIIGHEGINFVYSHKTDHGQFSISTFELKEVLDGVSFREPEVRKSIKELIENNLIEIKASK
ncbi:MAG: ATP-binding protein [Prolixibacteraceae bacterium]|nr:ATP-binding protein [Prolixibacteraceae bacterium]